MADQITFSVSPSIVLCDDVYVMLPQFMDNRDIKAFRLVSRRFADFGARWLVRDIWLHFRRSSFNHLEQISRHPIMAKHVRSISYFRPVAWDRDRDYEAWRTGEGRGSWPEEELAQGHKEVVSVLDEEAAIARIKPVSSQIKASVERFSGLRSVMMVTGSPDQMKQVSEHRSLIGFEQSHGIESYQGMWELTSLMVSARESRIKELRAGKLNCSFFSKGLVEKASMWWGGIRVLELELLRCWPKVSTEGVKGFLMGLQELEKLGISFDPYSEAGCAQLRDVFELNGRWKNLTELGVYGVKCKGDELLQLLSNHKCKLQRFKMACVELEPPDDWPQVMWAIRGLKLDKIEIGGWIKSEDGIWGGGCGVSGWMLGEDGVWGGGFGRTERWLMDIEMEGGCPLEPIIDADLE